MKHTELGSKGAEQGRARRLPGVYIMHAQYF